MAEITTRRLRAYAYTLQRLSSQDNVNGKIVVIERGARYISLGVRLNDYRQINKALNLAEPLAGATSTPVVIAQRERGLIMYQFELPSHFWEKYTRADLTIEPGRVGVGLDGKRQIDFAITPAAPHAGVFGTTGSGKTETMRSILCGLFTAYAPEKLRAVILDHKGKYDVFRNVAHLAGIPIAHEQAEIDHALAYVNRELEHRESNRIFDGRSLILAADETEAVFVDRSRRQIIEAIGKRGREVQIHLLVATQEPDKSNLPLGQILNRWVGLVDNAQTSVNLTGHAGLACHKLTGEGDFMHIVGRNQERLLVAMATRSDYDRLPRADIAPPDFEEVNPIDPDRLPPPPSGNAKGGRPSEDVEPEKVAYYVVHGPRNVSKSQASNVLGLGHILHYRHRDFAEALMAEANRLYQELKGAQRNGRQQQAY